MSLSNLATAPDAHRRSKGERTCDRIREAALDLFARLGFERVTMADIAREAEVSQPALHYHFADKDALWRGAIGMLAAAIAEEERLISSARDVSAFAALQIAMRHFVRLSWRWPALGRIVALEGMAGGERLDWLVENLIGRRNRNLLTLVRTAIADGDLKPFPPEQILILLQTGAAGAVNMAPLMRANFNYDPDQEDARADWEDLIVETLTAGLATGRNRDNRETNP